jgi:hypothetical protein
VVWDATRKDTPTTLIENAVGWLRQSLETRRQNWRCRAPVIAQQLGRAAQTPESEGCSQSAEVEKLDTHEAARIAVNSGNRRQPRSANQFRDAGSTDRKMNRQH